MEYEQMVGKIVDAEHSATELVDEAKVREEHLETDFRQRVDEMRARYLERARRRLELVAQTEEEAAEEAVAVWDRKLKDAMATVEDAYVKNKDQWVDTLFSLIVGVRP